MEKDIYAAMLEFGYKCGFEPVTYKDLYEWAYRDGFLDKQLSADAIKKLHEKNAQIRITDHKVYKIYNLFNKLFYQNSTSEKGRNFALESYFKYLQLVELKESRKNALEAKIFSYIAIGIAILSLLTSVGFDYYNRDRPIPIEQPIQVTDLQLSPLQIKLDSIENLLNRMNTSVIDSLNKQQ